MGSVVPHFVVLGIVGVFLLGLLVELLGLDAGLGKGLGGGVVDADTTGTARLDNRRVDLIERLLLRKRKTTGEFNASRRRASNTR